MSWAIYIWNIIWTGYRKENEREIQVKCAYLQDYAILRIFIFFIHIFQLHKAIHGTKS